MGGDSLSLADWHDPGGAPWHIVGLRYRGDVDADIEAHMLDREASSMCASGIMVAIITVGCVKLDD